MSRTWKPAAAGGGLSLALAWGLPGAGGLAGVLIAAPAVIGLLAGLPARSLLAPAGGRIQLAGAGVLALAALGWPRLGLRYADALVPALIAAGLFLLLGWAVAERLAALPAAGGRERAPARELTLLVLAVYLALLPWATSKRPPDGDEPHYLLLAHSLAYDLDADLANNYAAGDSRRFMGRAIGPQPGDPSGPAGERYSRHGATLPLALAPFYRVGGKGAALVVMAILTALLAGTLVRIGALALPDARRGVLRAAALAGLSPPLLLYSYQVWAEVPAALLLAQGWLGALEIERGGRPARTGWLRLAAAGVLLPALKLRFLMVSIPLLALALLRAPPALRRPARWALIGAAGVGAGLMGVNQLRFGEPLRHIPVSALLDQLAPAAAYLRGLSGLLFDCGFGLFAAAPIWILLFPAAVELARRHRRLLADGLILGLPYLLLLAPRADWYGSWSPPFRYALVLLPLLAVASMPLLAPRRVARHPLVVLLTALSVALALVWALLPGWTYSFADGRSHLLDHLSRLAGSDVARFFPSQLRPRAANTVWAIVVPALALAGWSLGRRCRWRRQTAVAAAGLTLVLALPTLIFAARRLPLRVVEAEDPYLERRGGEPYPGRWSTDRGRRTGGWLLRAGDEIGVLVAGGEPVEMIVRLRTVSPDARRGLLELRRGGEPLAAIPLPPPGGWSEHRLEARPWPRRERLVLAVPRGDPGEVIVDRVELLRGRRSPAGSPAPPLPQPAPSAAPEAPAAPGSAPASR